jgi:Mn-dependent DtxR family transcriptional regulator
MTEKEMKDLEDIERRLLQCLADEWETSGPPGYLETAEIAKSLKISVDKTKSTIRSLFVSGLVDTDEVETYAAYLTPEGHEFALRIKPQKD